MTIKVRLYTYINDMINVFIQIYYTFICVYVCARMRVYACTYIYLFITNYLRLNMSIYV